MTARREALLQGEIEGWERLDRAVDGLTDEELARPGLTAEGWSVRDLLWHLAAWSEEAVRVLDRMRVGTWDGTDPSLEPGWTDRMNAEWFERSRRMGLDEVRSAAPVARDRMREAFEVLEAVTPDAAEWFEESGPMHYADHQPGLEAWIGQLRAEG